MKKALSILVLFVSTCIAANAQTEVLFKMQMLPNHDYSCNMKMNMDMDMGALAQASGPMKMEMGMQMEMKTGAIGSKNEFPVSMAMQMSPSSMTMNGKTMPVPAAATAAIPTMYGKCKVGGLPRIDSIPGTVMTDSLKTAMNKMMENFQNTLKFPDKPMKIGDTFTQDMPFDLPMMGAAMKAEAKVLYKLISITGGKANFDVSYTMDMNMAAGKTMPVEMHMNGGGTGTMEYDIALSYPTHYIQNMDMNMTIPTGDKTLAMKMKMKMDQQTSVK